MQELRAAPRASALIEAMRDIGYSLETALADIVDNSITAEADSIDILFDAGSERTAVAVIDDGQGMSSDELLSAMRPGSMNPLEDRAESDLGRFGLGLKTASFSQCRRLTVVTRKGDSTSAACWDLDYVAKTDDWVIQIPDYDEISALPFIDRLGSTGTLVLWENMDRLVGEISSGELKDHLYERMDNARCHLELVFHRFLDGERPYRKVILRINDSPLEAFDPFNSRHPATIRQPKEEIVIDGKRIIVQPFILPHHKKVSLRDWEKYGGEAGYLKNQGFYVYRVGRLIIHGTWFRLAKQAELTKLARVRVDMPNGLDHLWKIDVKKASAQLPFVVRQRLKKIIDEIGGASNRVYTARGRKLVDPSVTSLWSRRIDKNEICYEVNRDHPAIAGFMAPLKDDQRAQFLSLLQAIDRSFPVDAIFSDVAGQPEAISRGKVAEDSLNHLIRITCGVFREQGLSTDDIRKIMRKTEPYRSSWEATDKILNEIIVELTNES